MAIFLAIGALGGLVQFVCSIMVLIHAFQRDVATGFMCLCIPCYIVYYMHTQFEHEQKQLIIAGFWGGVAINIVGRVLGGGFSRARF